MPSDTKFRYDYSQGHVWKYNDLLSPFDYTILKSEDRLRKEQEHIRAISIPYYRLEQKTGKERQEAFAAAVVANWNDCAYSLAGSGTLSTLKKADKDSLKRQKHIRAGTRLLHEVFEAGIVEWDDAHENRPEDAEVFLLIGNKVKSHEKQHFRTLKGAYTYIEKKLNKEKKTDQAFLLEHISNALKYNVFFDEHKTGFELESQLKRLGNTHGLVSSGEKVIGRGEMVDALKFMKLESLKAEHQKKAGGLQDRYWILLGQIVLVSLCMLVLYIFLYLFHKEVLRNNKNITFLLLLVVMLAFLTHLSMRFDGIDLYLVPVCLAPIIIRAFFDAELALFVHIVTVLSISFMVPDQFAFAFMHLIAGVVALFSINNLRKRSQFFISVGFTFLAYASVWFSLSVFTEGDPDHANYEKLAWLAGNAALMLFSFPLIFIFEKIFGFVSETTLMELADTNGSLLRELTGKAPGTFQHTLQVANLAEEAIYAIGGNTLLVRTGALYHDIGKMNNPMYFIENQSGINPHDELPPDESAGIIIDHVIDGIEMARKHNLPDQVIDFIRTHHGTTRTEYFYRTYLRDQESEHPEDDAAFRYPGPLPYSKETAVLMMSDSVEAASRSLREYNVESIEKLVNGIIDGQMKMGQFVNADITFKDITLIKKIFIKKLMNIYHARIAYPKR